MNIIDGFIREAIAAKVFIVPAREISSYEVAQHAALMSHEISGCYMSQIFRRDSCLVGNVFQFLNMFVVLLAHFLKHKLERIRRRPKLRVF